MLGYADEEDHRLKPLPTITFESSTTGVELFHEMVQQNRSSIQYVGVILDSILSGRVNAHRLITLDNR